MPGMMPCNDAGARICRTLHYGLPILQARTPHSSGISVSAPHQDNRSTGRPSMDQRGMVQSENNHGNLHDRVSTSVA